MEQPETVRWATPADETNIYDALVELHRLNGFGWGYPFRPEIVLAQIEVGTRADPKTRSNPQDQRRGVIGVIDSADGKIAGVIGVFFITPMWFTDWAVPTELFLFVRPTERSRRRYERDLFNFARWFRDSLKSQPSMQDSRLPFPLMTGFIHVDNPKRPLLAVMDRLWQRLSGGKKIGILFMVE